MAAWPHARLDEVASNLITLFHLPVLHCRLDPAVVRTIPVVIAILCALVFMCLGTPRQCIGCQNVDETCPPLESSKMGDNPIFSHGRGPGSHTQSQQYPGPPPSIPEGEEDEFDGPPQGSFGQPPLTNSGQSLQKQGSQGYREDRYDSRSREQRASVRNSRSPDPGLRNDGGRSTRDMHPEDRA